MVFFCSFSGLVDDIITKNLKPMKVLMLGGSNIAYLFLNDDNEWVYIIKISTRVHGYELWIRNLLKCSVYFNTVKTYPTGLRMLF